VVSRPQDVSQEAWDAAIAAVSTAYTEGEATVTVARAITAAVAAEREACAVVAEALERGEREWVRDSLWANIKADTARAIRARSTSC